jgi:hypothetical protein
MDRERSVDRLQPALLLDRDRDPGRRIRTDQQHALHLAALAGQRLEMGVDPEFARTSEELRPVIHAGLTAGGSFEMRVGPGAGRRRAVAQLPERSAAQFCHRVAQRHEQRFVRLHQSTVEVELGDEAAGRHGVDASLRVLLALRDVGDVRRDHQRLDRLPILARDRREDRVEPEAISTRGIHGEQLPVRITLRKGTEARPHAAARAVKAQHIVRFEVCQRVAGEIQEGLVGADHRAGRQRHPRHDATADGLLQHRRAVIRAQRIHIRKQFRHSCISRFIAEPRRRNGSRGGPGSRIVSIFQTTMSRTS